MPHSNTRGHFCIRLSPDLVQLCIIFFTQIEIRAISELRVRLVPLNLLKLSSACISLADSSKAVQIFFIIFLNLYFMFSCLLHLEIYVKTMTFTLYCGGVWGGEAGGGNGDVARLVLPGYGIALSEIFGVIREDSLCCVLVRISAPQIASNRSLSLMDANILFARASVLQLVFVNLS